MVVYKSGLFGREGMASTAWTGWEAEGDDEARFKAWLNASWLSTLACAAAWGLAVSIPFGFNYEWNHARGWYYVAFAILTASLAPSMVSCIASLNLGKRARLFCTFLMIGCLCYDWSNPPESMPQTRTSSTPAPPSRNQSPITPQRTVRAWKAR